MPLPLAALAAIAAIPGAIDTGSAIWQSTTNDESQKLNRERLEQLRKLQKAGGLGLNAVEERNLQETLVSPVQKAAAEGRLRAEQIAAAAGGSATAGDLSRLRTEQSRAVGQAGQEAALAIRQADMAKRQAQRAEIEGRTQAKGAMKADDIQTILAAVAKMAGAAGGPMGAIQGIPSIGALAGGGGAAPAAPAAPVDTEAYKDALMRALQLQQEERQRQALADADAAIGMTNFR